MRFDVLGPLRALSGDEELHLGEPQQQKLLAVLLAMDGHTATTDRLIDEIWGEEPPPSARHLIHVYVTRLRSVFRKAEGDQRILRAGRGYQLLVEASEVDALVLEDAVEQHRQSPDADLSKTAERLREATAAWRGRPFDTFADEIPVLRSEAQRLEELYLGALEDLLETELALGRHAETLTRLEELIALHPYRERFWELRMLALYRCGRQADALQAYHDLRRTLAGELGLEVGHAIAALERRILLHDPELLWEPPPPPSNLPSPVSSFVGRRQELGEVERILDGSRLVTLTGPGGIGKTRLAMEVAERMRDRFGDGLWWVDLAQVRDDELVTAAVAEALGVRPQPHTPLIESIVQALLRRTALLLVDNCEHLLEPVADLVTAIIRGTRHVRILSTSRSMLRVPGETRYVVPPLTMPSAGTDDPAILRLADAVQLFAVRAGAADASFSLEASNGPAVVDICRRLDGSPLAIEMAAVQVRVLSPAQIATELSDRFDFLSQNAPTERHDSLGAALDWSYGLMSQEHRAAFERLCVFAGPFDLAAAEAVVGTGHRATLKAVTALVDASMLSTLRPSPIDMRYRFLETIREYGSRLLRAGRHEPATREAHAGYFLELVEQGQGLLGTRDFPAWVERVRSVYPDLRQALEWSLDHGWQARVLGIGRAMFHYWFTTGDALEAGSWGRRMLERAASEPAALRASGHHLVSFGANMVGDADVAIAEADRAIELSRQAGDAVSLATNLFGRGNAAMLMGDPAGAAVAAREALALSLQTGDRWNRAGALAILGFVDLASGDLRAARRSSEEAAAIYRELGDVAGQVVMCPVSTMAIRQGDLEAAESLAGQALVAAMGTAWEGAALVNVAEVQLAQGDVDAAEAVAMLGLTKALDAGVEIWFRHALLALARVHAGRGDAERAAVLLGASGRNAFALELDPGTARALEDSCREGLGARGFEDARVRGRELDTESLIDLVSGSTDGARPAAAGHPGSSRS